MRETERSQSPLKPPFLEEQMSKRRLIRHNDYSMCHSFTALCISYWAILRLSVAQERLPGREAVQPDLSTHSAALETHRASALLRVPDVFLRLTDMRRRGKIRPTSSQAKRFSSRRSAPPVTPEAPPGSSTPFPCWCLQQFSCCSPSASSSRVTSDSCSSDLRDQQAQF